MGDLTSRRDRDCMRKAVDFENDHAERAHRLRENFNRLTWAAHAEHESGRKKTHQEVIEGEKNRNHVMVQATQKRRELQSARAAAWRKSCASAGNTGKHC